MKKVRFFIAAAIIVTAFVLSVADKITTGEHLIICLLALVLQSTLFND